MLITNLQIQMAVPQGILPAPMGPTIILRPSKGPAQKLSDGAHQAEIPDRIFLI